MLSKPKNNSQLGLFITFEDQLNHRHLLFQLAKTIDWQVFEEAFSKHYSATMGAPSKPIRLMVSLLILKQLRNLSDESVVEQWSENAYYQYFGGEQSFRPEQPCVATELVEFRKRIGSVGIELILKESIRINGKDSNDDTVSRIKLIVRAAVLPAPSAALNTNTLAPSANGTVLAKLLSFANGSKSAPSVSAASSESFPVIAMLDRLVSVPATGLRSTNVGATVSSVIASVLVA